MNTVATVSLAALLAGGLIVAAVRADGFNASEVTLHDAGIWVTKPDEVGRFNTQLSLVDARSGQQFPGADVVQSESTVIVRAGARVYSYDVATNRQRIDAGVPLDGAASLSIGGANGLIVAPETGRVVFLDRDAIGLVNLADTERFVDIEGATTGVVDARGVAHVVDTSTGRVWRFTQPFDDRVAASIEGAPATDAATTVPSVVDQFEVSVPEPITLDRDLGSMTMSAVGGELVFLDAQRRVLLTTTGEEIVVPTELGDGLRLAPPSAATDRSVLVSGDGGLAFVHLGNGDARFLDTVGGSIGITPLRLGNCAYGAWTERVVQSCTDGLVVEQAITGERPEAFRTNRARVVLNFPSGSLMFFTPDGVVSIDSEWNDALTNEREVPEPIEQNAESEENTCEIDAQTNTPPRAVDDEFTVRAGQTAVLDVLSGVGSGGSPDADDDCDVLTVALQNGAEAGTGGVLSVIRKGRALQFTPSEPGVQTFEYVLSDGRSEQTAVGTVTVNVTGADDDGNQPPVAKPDVLSVEAGKTAVVDLLGNDADPDGDPIAVSSVIDDEQLVWQPNGRVTFTAPGGTPGQIVVGYTIVDTRGLEATGELVVNVTQQGVNVAPNLVDDVVQGSEGSEISLNVLENDSDPNNDVLRVTSIEALSANAPTSLVSRGDNGMVTFDAAQAGVAGTHVFAYTVTDEGGTSRQARLRVEVRPLGARTPPVAVRDDAVVALGQLQYVDVLQNDVDVDGDLLAVASVRALDNAGDQLSVEVIDRRYVRVVTTSLASVDALYRVEYRVSDGDTTVSGQISVRVVRATGGQAPIAVNDATAVHTGGAIAIPVLANDSDPDGDELVLVTAKLADQDGDKGALFIAGSELRYVAAAADSPTTGADTVTATYTITDGRDQATGLVQIAIVPTAENLPPNPPILEIRAGERVGDPASDAERLVLPAAGMDPDGDPVQVVRIVAAPRKGVVEIDGGSFIYTPSTAVDGVPVTGQDRFTYEVRDGFGLPGVGVVRVVIVPRGPNSPPVAVADRIEVEPGATVNIPVLFNDTDPDGDIISFTQVDPVTQPTSGSASVSDTTTGAVRFTAPDEVGEFTFGYRVTDSKSPPVWGDVTVVVTTDVANLPPVARDDAAEAVELNERLVIDVLANDFDPEGGALALRPGDDAERLGVTLQPGPDGTVMLTMLQLDRAVSFTYHVADDRGNESTALVQVGAPRNDPPRPVALTLTLAAGEDSLEVDVTSAFDPVDRDGDPVSVYTETRPSVITAGAGGALAWNATGTGFTFPRPAQWAGQAIVLYTVTDGVHFVEAPVVINVEPETNTPPVVLEQPLLVEAGSFITWTARDLASDVDPGDAEQLVITATQLNGDFAGAVTVTLDDGGGSMTITATAAAAPTIGELVVTVSDGAADGSASGTLELSIVQKSSELARAQDDAPPPIDQGAGPVTIDVLANDSPGGLGPIRIVGTTAAEGSETLQVVDDDTAIVFTPLEGWDGLTSFTYTIADSSGDVSRQSTATVRVAVRNRPDAPSAPVIGERLSATAIVSFNRPDDNGAAIETFEVESSSGISVECAASPCEVADLTNGEEYRFRVRARNVVGWSEWSPLSSPYTPDEYPGQPPRPQIDWNDGSITVTWGAIPNDGSPITLTRIIVSPSDVAEVVIEGGQEGRAEIPVVGLVNGTEYTVSIIATNQLGDSPVSPSSTSQVPAGPPLGVVAPTIGRDDGTNGAGGVIRVTFTTPDGNGDVAGLRYTVQLRPTDGSATPAPRDFTDSGPWLMPATNGVSYTATVTVHNKYTARYGGPVESPPSGEATASGRPISLTAAPTINSVTSGSVVLNLNHDPANRAINNGSPITSYVVYVSDGSTRTLPYTAGATTLTVTGLSNTSSSGYTFQLAPVNMNGTADNRSPASSPSAFPFGQPSQPAFTGSSHSGTTITWTWSLGAWNGPNPTTVRVRVNGGAWVAPTTSTSYTVNVGTHGTYTLTVEACNDGPNRTGASGSGCNTQSDPHTIPAPDPPTVWTTQGSASSPCDTNTSLQCYFFYVNVSGFAPGSYTFTCFPNTPYDYLTGTINVGANGTGQAYTGSTSFCEAVDGGEATVQVNSVNGSGSGYW